jgi:hypothetical protein
MPLLIVLLHGINISFLLDLCGKFFKISCSPERSVIRKPFRKYYNQISTKFPSICWPKLFPITYKDLVLILQRTVRFPRKENLLINISFFITDYLYLF